MSECAVDWSKGGGKFAISDSKLYVSVLTSSTQDNAKLLQQFKSGFKRTINWNKYQSKVTIERKKNIQVT